ncbi:MAG: hypothetical protein KGN84_05915, partial [Acidobacteriota bacterium]|nr:hypothetical protein [Acidobacteriota bacterium]
QRFDADFRNSPLSREVSLNRRFFELIAKAIALAKPHPPIDSDGSETLQETAAVPPPEPDEELRPAQQQQQQQQQQ